MGAITRAWHALISGSIAVTIGIPKAPVFPLPVCACTIRSDPSRMRGMTFSWTAIGSLHLRSRMPVRTGSGRSAKNSDSSLIGGGG